jgi:hypothetical protein
MLEAHATAGDAPTRGSLHSCGGLAPRLLLRHGHLNLIELERYEITILAKPAPRRQGIQCRLGHSLTVGAPG